MRHSLREHYDIVLFGFVTLVMAGVFVYGLDSWRARATLLGVMVVAGVTARVIAYWRDMTVLEVTLAVMAAITVAVGAVGTYRLDKIDAPASGVIGWIIASRLMWLGIIVVWPALVGRPLPDPRALFRSNRR